MANSAKPDTVLGWYRRFIARKFDGSKALRYPGRPRVDREIEDLVARMAKENIDWGYDRIVGELANLGYTVSDETVGNILRRYGTLPAPERKRNMTWRDFIKANMAASVFADWLICRLYCHQYHGRFQLPVVSHLSLAGIPPRKYGDEADVLEPH